MGVPHDDGFVHLHPVDNAAQRRGYRHIVLLVGVEFEKAVDQHEVVVSVGIYVHVAAVKGVGAVHHNGAVVVCVAGIVGRVAVRRVDR